MKTPQKRTSRIREAVLEERMPPWHADPRYGKFANDRRLTQDERDTLLAWIDAGCAEGRRQGPAAPVEVRRRAGRSASRTRSSR